MTTKKKVYTEEQMKDIVQIATNERAKPATDSFSLFRDGLSKNWVFIMFIASTASWLVTNMLTLRQKNETQDTALASIAKTLETIEINNTNYRNQFQADINDIKQSNTDLLVEFRSFKAKTE